MCANYQHNNLKPEITVLYAEDDEGDSFFMRHAFDTAGLGPCLRIVPDGRAAIEYLAGSGPFADRAQYPLPSLVLLDLNMPQVSGFEVLQWIRKDPACANLPVIIFTSSSYPEDRMKAQALGASDYWQKPGSGLRFIEVVAKLREKWVSPAPASPSPPSQLRLAK